MEKEESVEHSPPTIPEEKETEDDTNSNKLVVVICCTNLLLFIVTLVLLIMVFAGFFGASVPELKNAKEEGSKGNFMLICAFEYLRQTLARHHPVCTHYVYIRLFVYSHLVNQEPLVFEPKRRTDGTVVLYYEDNALVWNMLKNHRHLDHLVLVSMRRFNRSCWCLGMWGATYMRLMQGLWAARIVRDALYNTLRSNFSHYLTMDNFSGFAIINSFLADYRPLGPARSYSHVFRDTEYGEPVLPKHWTFIHTAAIWPGGNRVVPESMIVDILKEAKLVGISTSNSSDESNLLRFLGSGNNVPYLGASPPNPLHAPGPGTRGMLDTLKDFPYWKRVLNRTKLCFSVTSAINYAYSSVDEIDFVRPMRLKENVQRYSRLRFVTKNDRRKYPVEVFNLSYYFDDTTYTHYWRRLSKRKELLVFFAYDTGETLQYKVTEMLKAYGDDKCVVFDDLGDDFFPVNITVGCRTIAFETHELLKAVRAALRDFYTAPSSG